MKILALVMVLGMCAPTVARAEKCRTRCSEKAKTCKLRCKITGAQMEEAKKQCLQKCELHEHECKAGC